MTNLKIKDAPYDLFCIGEVLIDQIIDYRNHKHTLFGGSPANITINTKQLGLNSILAASIGNDSYASYIKNTLSAYEIPQNLIQEHVGSTSVVVMNQTKHTPKPLFKRQSDYKIELNDDLLKTCENTKILHYSFWPLSKNPSKDTLFTLLKKAKTAGALIAFDPNIHESLLTEESLLKEDVLTMISKYVDIIKPSLDDASRLFGKLESVEAYMDAFEALNVSLIMMTLGKDGVLVSLNKERTYYKTQTREVIDATGAGDAFWAGFYKGFLSGYPLEQAITYAQKVSAVTLNHLGAIAPLKEYIKAIERSI